MRAAQLVQRPVAGVEAGEQRPRRPLQPLRERGRSGVPGGLAVLAQGDHRLQLRVENDLVAEAVEAHPEARRRVEQQVGDGVVGARGGDRQLRVAEERARPRERLRGERLRHSRRPRRPAGTVGERVLPDQPVPTRNGPRQERGGERLRHFDVVRGGCVRERREAREWMELETLVRKPAIDDSIGVADVDAVERDAVRFEICEVLLQLREERKRARRRVRVPHRRQLRELRRDHPRAQRRQAAFVPERAVDVTPVARGVVRFQPVLCERLRDAAEREVRSRRDARRGCRGPDEEERRSGPRRPPHLSERTGSTAYRLEYPCSNRRIPSPDTGT